MAHDLATVPVFAGLPAAALASGLYGAGTAVTMLVTMGAGQCGLRPIARLVNLGGPFQRASIITGIAWLTTQPAPALRRTPTTAAPRQQAS